LVRLYAPANRIRAPSTRPEVDLRFSPHCPDWKTRYRGFLPHCLFKKPGTGWMVLCIAHSWALDKNTHGTLIIRNDHTLSASVPDPKLVSPKDSDPPLFHIKLRNVLWKCIKKWVNSSWLPTQFLKTSKVEDFNPLVSSFLTKLTTSFSPFLVYRRIRSRIWIRIRNSKFTFWGSWTVVNNFVSETLSAVVWIQHIQNVFFFLL